MRIVAMALGASILCTAARAPATEITVTDCTLAPVLVLGGSTRIDVGANDLVLACPLRPLSGTRKIKLRANTITIRGPDGGISSDSKGIAIDLRADDMIVIKAAALEASDGNGGMQLVSRNGFDIENAVLATGAGTLAGRRTTIRCTAPDCPLTMLKSNLLGHYIRIKTLGKIVAVNNTIVTRGSRDLIDIRSLESDADLCCTKVDGRTEGNFVVQAFCQVNLTRSEVHVGEGILVTSGIGDGGCVGPTSTLLTGTTLDNDFGKLGEIVVTADHDDATIDIDQATLIDDDVRHPGDVSTLNGCATLPRSGCPNVTGTAATDS
jgi:hypothetical protein